LFEYLTDLTVRQLMQILFDKLNNMCLLLIGNYSNDGFFKSYMDFCGEWFLFYRNEQNLKELTKNIENKRNVFVEKSGVLFLNIQK